VLGCCDELQKTELQQTLVEGRRAVGVTQPVRAVNQLHAPVTHAAAPIVTHHPLLLLLIRWNRGRHVRRMRKQWCRPGQRFSALIQHIIVIDNTARTTIILANSEHFLAQ